MKNLLIPASLLFAGLFLGVIATVALRPNDTASPQAEQSGAGITKGGSTKSKSQISDLDSDPNTTSQDPTLQLPKGSQAPLGAQANQRPGTNRASASPNSSAATNKKSGPSDSLANQNSATSTESGSASVSGNIAGNPGAGGLDSTGPGAAQSALPAAQAGSQREFAQAVPTGAVVPAVYYDEVPRTPQQLAAMDRIMDEFENNVTNRDQGISESENWQYARDIADQRYIKLFGFQNYNQIHLRAAREALPERIPPATPQQ